MRTVLKKYGMMTLALCAASGVFAQDLLPITVKKKSIYSTLVADMSFQMANKQLSTEEQSEVTMRTIVFTNWAHYTHFNFNNNVGAIAGWGVRNIGIRAHNELIDSVVYRHTVRRIYTLNASLAVKLGSFSKHCFAYGGGEYDMAFHFRQRLKTKTNSRIKDGEWWSTATDRFLPSVFVGMQFPHGVNIKCSYYLHDFFNRNYTGKITNFPVYEQSRMINVSLSLQFQKLNLLKTVLDSFDAKAQSVEM
ncbi:MAG: hypothetical protein LBU90_06735 [Bacteroidales bacterium]|jgi:hypothetical protein|nr:hypothetical protein [Bacteroidales bacterium]